MSSILFFLFTISFLYLIYPSDGSRNKESTYNKELLPHPEGPSSITVSPLEKEISVVSKTISSSSPSLNFILIFSADNILIIYLLSISIRRSVFLNLRITGTPENKITKKGITKVKHIFCADITFIT